MSQLTHRLNWGEVRSFRGTCDAIVAETSCPSLRIGGKAAPRGRPYSCNQRIGVECHDSIRQLEGCIVKCLADILVFDFRKSGQALGAIRIQRGYLKHPAHGHAQISQARLAIEFGRVDDYRAITTTSRASHDLGRVQVQMATVRTAVGEAPPDRKKMAIWPIAKSAEVFYACAVH